MFNDTYGRHTTAAQSCRKGFEYSCPFPSQSDEQTLIDLSANPSVKFQPLYTVILQGKNHTAD
jgi:hypothetical protein